MPGGVECDRGHWGLLVDANLAKRVHGHNAVVLSVDEVEGALRDLYAGLMDAGLRNPPSVEEWRVVQAEFPHDWRVNAPDAYVSHAIRAYRSTYGRALVELSTSSLSGRTFQVRGGGTSIKLYNKEAETRRWADQREGRNHPRRDDVLKASEGRLRAEATIKGARIKTLLGGSPTVLGLTEHLRAEGNLAVRNAFDPLIENWHLVGRSDLADRVAYARRSGASQSTLDAVVSVHALGIEAYRQAFQPNAETLRTKLKRVREAVDGFDAEGDLPVLNFGTSVL
ncbi:hypothetical protein EON82_26555 [bacterium]|nr:MAG: hypothetical protein EON82_26555 [bacterium]